MYRVTLCKQGTVLAITEFVGREDAELFADLFAAGMKRYHGENGAGYAIISIIGNSEEAMNYGVTYVHGYFAANGEVTML